MAKSKTDKCIEALIGSAEFLGDEHVSQASGMSLKCVRRLRADEGFIRKTNARAKLKFVSEMPRVLRALAEAASDGKNASAMKLFLDVCRLFEADGPEGAADGEIDVDDLIRLARDAGIFDDGSNDRDTG